MATLVPWVPESDWPLPLSQPMGWQNGGKMAPRGGKKAQNRSISRMQRGRKSRSLPEGRSKPWPGGKPAQRPAWPAGDQLWFNSRICAGEKSGVAGVELATASEPPAPAADLGASPFRRRPQPPLSCDLRLDHARFPCRRCQKAGPVRSGRSLLAHDIIECLRGGDDRSAMGLAAAATWPALILQHSTFVVACICPRWRESDELMAAIDPGMPGIGIDPGGVRRPGGDHANVPAGDCPPANGPGQ